MTREYEARDESMVNYLGKTKWESSRLRSFEIQLIPRSQNNKADALSKLASSSLLDVSRSGLVDVRKTKSINGDNEVYPVEVEPSWMDDIIAYKTHWVLPSDPVQARRVQVRATHFVMIDGELYQKSFDSPLQKCVGPSDAKFILDEIHNRICGHHMGARTLAHKALRQGFWWPTMVQDSKDLSRICRNCQVHANDISLLARDLQPILSPIPFARWGMDILGPFATGTGGRKFLIVPVDYFSKWVEAEAVARITETEVMRMIWKNIITRFGVPKVMVFDHGRQFDNGPIQEWLTTFGVVFSYSSVCHPQCNGQAETANKQLLLGLKKKLDDRKGRWADELPGVLWSLKTTEKEAMGYTPFHLVNGSEALLLVETTIGSIRSKHFQGNENEKALRASLDFLDEDRDNARLTAAAYKSRISRAYNRRV